MISVAEATQRVVAVFAPVASQTVPVGEAFARVLAEPVEARMTQPPAPMSSMDGYAVRAADVPGTLKLAGSAPAGHPFAGSLGAGQTVRIFTGGVVPDGADAIVIQEDTEAQGARIVMKVAAKPGKHIRPAGMDFRQGDLLAPPGRRLTARDLSLIAAGDVAEVRVRRKPVVVVAATGDELSLPGQPRSAGGIVASSGFALKAMIESWGGGVRDLGVLPDRIEAIQGIADAAQGADLVVTLGGASVGDHDLIQNALGPRGFELDFWKIAMRPGKPLIFGRLGGVPLIGLPGNPVSALVCATLFVQPAISALLGTETRIATRAAKLAQPLGPNDSRQDYLRCETTTRDGELWVRAFDVQDSSMLSGLAKADALIVRPPHATAIPAGARVEVIPL
ncbi:MAG: molybdopterin molybdotransferase MoeA [Alphaproteobacteria bacterium]|nr:molybdopterin molybdotransferase MoeA [Alphaproteobacteria bacterium]MBV9693319.1 molybdopterin molybdotransferase MoeA [Alphaproteobacteria bacterium]